MKKHNLMMLALMGITGGLAANGEAGEPVSQGDGSREQIMCSKLSPDERSFSSKLNDANRKMFCGKFTPEQRKSSMMASCNSRANCGLNRNAGKKVMSPDEAVQKVIKDNKMSMSEKRESLSASEDNLGE